MVLPVETFTAQPFIVAAFGEDHANLWHELLSHAPVPVTGLLDERLVRFASSKSEGLERVRGGWCWGRHTDSRRRPADRRDAAHELDLAGLWWDGAHAVVHTGGLGVAEVYVRDIAGTVYIANRLTPLASIGPPLHADWDAWAFFLSSQSFSTEETPFVEIRRLPAGGSIRIDGTRTIDLPTWLTDPRGSSTREDVWKALNAAISPRRFGSIDVTLSGGLDSRLILASLTQRRTRAVTTWTTEGSPGDVEMAPAVAAARGVPNRVVASSIADWIANLLPVTRRLEHLSPLHNWLPPLLKEMEGRRATLYDGFAGDVLLKREDLGGVSPERFAWQALTAFRLEPGDGRPPSLSADFRSTYGDRLFERWADRHRLWAGHRAERIIRHFMTRPGQNAALSPFRLFAPGHRVVTPWIDRDVMAAALTLGRDGKERDYRNNMLYHFARDLHALSATSRPNSPRHGFVTRHIAPSAVEHVASIIAREPMASSPLDPALLAQLTTGDPPLSFLQGRLVHNCAVLSDWLTTWRPRLVSTDHDWR